MNTGTRVFMLRDSFGELRPKRYREGIVELGGGGAIVRVRWGSPKERFPILQEVHVSRLTELRGE